MTQDKKNAGDVLREAAGKKIREVLDQSYREQVKDMDRLESEQLVITLLGDGPKKEVTQALTGMDYTSLPAEDGFAPGTIVHSVQENIFLADTPWFGKNIKVPFRHIEKTSDLILWFPEDDQTLPPPAEQFLEAIPEEGIPVIAVLPPSSGGDESGHLYEELSLAEGVIPLVTDPADEASVERLSHEIVRLLAQRDKEMLYLRITLHKAQTVTRWVMAAAATALGIGALPLPGPDSLPLTALQTGLCLRIAYVFGHNLSKEDLGVLVTTPVTARAGRKLAILAEGFIARSSRLPAGAKTVAVAGSRGMVAAAITYGLGMACFTWYRSGMAEQAAGLKEMLREFAEKYLKENL